MILRVFLAVCAFLSLRDAGAQITLVYTANRQGETKPCGCKIRDIGGLNRMEQRISQLKKQGPLLFLDAGNAFFSAPKISRSRLGEEKKRAQIIAQSYQRMGMEAFSPGERDFAAGTKTFWELIRKSAAKPVSANLVATSNEGVFQKFVVWKNQDMRIVITGLTAVDSLVMPQGLKQRDPKEAIREIWKDIQGEKPTQVLLLSHLGTREDEELAKEFSGIWIIGSKSMDFFKEPKKWGNSFLFEVGIGGQRLGEIGIEQNKTGWIRAELTELGEEYDSK